MNNNPKFMVFHLRKLLLIIASVFLFLLASLFIVKFLSDDKNEQKKDTDKYVAGTYSSSINLNNASAELTVTVDKNHINNIKLINTSDTVETMYPLMSPAIEDIAKKVIANQSTRHIACSKENLYTYTLLLGEIEKLLDSATYH